MKEIVKQIMSDVLEVPIGDVNEAMTMDNTDTWDSLRHMEIIVAFEERFEIEVEASEFLEMTTLVEIERVLREKGVEA
jgi:acyl carrier protein